MYYRTYTELITFCKYLPIRQLMAYKDAVKEMKNKEFLIAREVLKIRISKKNKIINKKIFKKFSSKDGSPDGMTLDNNKNLWVAHFHGACISVFNNSAKLIHRIQLPAKNITNCTFGGKNNSVSRWYQHRKTCSAGKK